jgi:hypothetical protein
MVRPRLSALLVAEALSKLLLELGEQALKLQRKLAQVRRPPAGEPFKSHLDPGRLARRLHEIGFSTTEDLDGAANARYFAHRTDGLLVGSARPRDGGLGVRFETWVTNMTPAAGRSRHLEHGDHQ